MVVNAYTVVDVCINIHVVFVYKTYRYTFSIVWFVLRIFVNVLLGKVYLPFYVRFIRNMPVRMYMFTHTCCRRVGYALQK